MAKVRSLIEAERVERETEARIHAMEEEEMRARREASTVHPQRSPPTITPLNTFHPEAGAEAGPFIRLEEETEDDRSPTHAEPPLRPSIIDENTPILERATPMLERTQLKPATSDIGPPLAPPVTEPIPPKIDPKPNPAPVATGLPLERDGLCVVCQDEAANIAIVDCGSVWAIFSSGFKLC